MADRQKQGSPTLTTRFESPVAPAPRPQGGSPLRPAGRSALAVLFLVVFLDLVGFGIVIPLLPLYAERFGAGAMEVTWLVAVFSLMQFFFAPWWGALSDRVGRRPVLLAGLFGSALSYLGFGLAGSLTALFLARAVAGLMGATVGVAQAYIADITSPEERARGMGLIGAAFGLGFIFGPVIGGALSRFGPSVPFYAAGTLALANGLWALARLPESLPRSERREQPERGLGPRLRSLSSALRIPRLRSLLLAFFLFTLAFAAMEAVLSLWADRRWSFSPAEVAYAFAYLGVVTTLTQGALVGRLVRRLGERRVATVGTSFFAAGLLGIPFAPSLPLLALAGALLAFGQGTASPPI